MLLGVQSSYIPINIPGNHNGMRTQRSRYREGSRATSWTPLKDFKKFGHKNVSEFCGKYLEILDNQLAATAKKKEESVSCCRKKQT
jgi:hypothetical protein